MCDQPGIWLKFIIPYLTLSERIKSREVCREWKDIIDDSWHLVRSLVINAEYNPGEDIYSSRSTGMGLSLDVYQTAKRTQQLVNRLLFRCGKYLTILKATQMSSESAVFAAAIFCCRLQKLTIPISTKGQDKKLNYLLRANVNIEKLFISMYDTVLYLFLENLPAFKYLQELTVIRPTNGQPHDHLLVTMRRVIEKAHLDDNLIFAIGEKQNLERLKISGPLSQLSTLGRFQLSHLTNLRSLSIDSADTMYQKYWIDEELINSIVQHSHQLREIELMDSVTMTDVCILQLSHLPELESLCLCSIPGITGEYLQTSTRIKDLRLEECPVINAGVIKLLRAPNCLSSLALLKTRITMKTVEFANQMIDISDDERFSRLPLGQQITPTKDRFPRS